MAEHPGAVEGEGGSIGEAGGWEVHQVQEMEDLQMAHSGPADGGEGIADLEVQASQWVMVYAVLLPPVTKHSDFSHADHPQPP